MYSLGRVITQGKKILDISKISALSSDQKKLFQNTMNKINFFTLTQNKTKIL